MYIYDSPKYSYVMNAFSVNVFTDIKQDLFIKDSFKKYTLEEFNHILAHYYVLSYRRFKSSNSKDSHSPVRYITKSLNKLVSEKIIDANILNSNFFKVIYCAINSYYLNKWVFLTFHNQKEFLKQTMIKRQHAYNLLVQKKQLDFKQYYMVVGVNTFYGDLDANEFVDEYPLIVDYEV